MKTFKQFVLAVAMVAFAATMAEAQRSGTGSSNGDPSNGRKDSIGLRDLHLHRGLTDSCWQFFLSQLPPDTARILVSKIEEIKDIKLKIDTLLKDLRRARAAKDTAAARRIWEAIKELSMKGREDHHVVESIFDKYHELIERVRKECGEKHRTTTVEMKVTPLVPNPATTTTQCTYTLSAAANVMITISDQMGKVVKDVFSGQGNQGENLVNFDLSGMQAGIYLVRIQAENAVSTQKLVIGR